MRIALFGGSFDPIHRGHLAIAEAAVQAFRLDRVLFAPAGRQPHKRAGAAASFDQRLDMVRLACADSGIAGFEGSMLDAPLVDGSPNYTVRTLELLETACPRDRRFNLVGADTFESLAKWREPYRLLQLAEWIVVSRPGLPLRLPPGLALTAEQANRIHLLDSVHEEVTATGLRHRLAQGDPCLDLLPAGVATYIAEQGIYRTLLQ